MASALSRQTYRMKRTSESGHQLRLANVGLKLMRRRHSDRAFAILAVIAHCWLGEAAHAQAKLEASYTISVGVLTIGSIMMSADLEADFNTEVQHLEGEYRAAEKRGKPLPEYGSGVSCVDGC